jgi:hypothetical protein
MSSGSAAEAMPAELVEFLQGGRIVTGATIGADGLPYTMVMNSVVAVDEHTLRFALDRRTHTLRNIEAGSAMMLEIIGEGFIYGARGATRIVREVMEHAPVPSALIEISVQMVKRDLPPGVDVDAPSFRWGALEGYMTSVEPAMFEELRTTDR